MSKLNKYRVRTVKDDGSVIRDNIHEGYELARDIKWVRENLAHGGYEENEFTGSETSIEKISE